MKENDKLVELESACCKANIDILGISEIRRIGENLIKTKNQNLFCYYGDRLGQGGVGFLINCKWVNKLILFKGISERIALAKFDLGNNKSLTLIQVYAPTSMASDEDLAKFYEDLSNCFSGLSCNASQQVLIMGDFNSKIGKRELGEDQILGPYYYGTRNSRGYDLINFCLANNLKIINTWYKKPNRKKWTWISPNLEYKNQIDFFLAPTKEYSIKSFDVIKNFGVYSDHRPIMCDLEFTWRKKAPKKTKSKLSPLDYKDYQNELNRLLTGVNFNSILQLDVSEINEWIIKKLITASEKTINSSSNKVKCEAGEPNTEINDLIKKRDKLRLKRKKTPREKIELNILCKLVKKRNRERAKEKENKKISEILESTKSIKNIKKLKSLGSYWIPYVFDKWGNKKYSREEINKTATTFYAELYDNPVKTNVEIISSREILVEEEPTFLNEEIEDVLKSLNNNKASGYDGISNEHLKYGPSTKIVNLLTKFFNKVLQERKIPDGWKKSDIILIHKKGDKHKIDNYRPITLSSTLSKIFSKLIENRIKGIIVDQQPHEQAGFRRGYSTTDHLFTLNLLIEKSNEFQRDLHLAFIDFRKAFDSLDHDFMLVALRNQGVPNTYIKLIQEMYTNLKGRILTEREGEYFEIKKGVKQGDPLSPALFCCALEEIFRKLKWENRGIKINGEFLNNLRFADDVVLMADNLNELSEMLKELINASKEAGLIVNFSKTKIMTNQAELKNLEIGEDKIECVENIIYLGQTISLENKTEKEINNRIALGWKKFWSLKYILKENFSIKSKIDIMNSCILPVITYGSQTWSMNKKSKNKLNVTLNSMLRSISGAKLKDHVRISSLKLKFRGIRDFIQESRRKKWEWAGHIIRACDGRWGNKIMYWFSESKRKRGRQKARWRDEIVEFIRNKQFHRVAWDRAEWARLKESFAQEMGLA